MMRVKDIVAACWTRTRLYLMAAGLLCTLFVLYFWNDIVVTIHSGELGVKYSRFWGGTDLSETYPEGIYFIWPFDIMYVYDARILEHTETFVMLTYTGLPVTVSVSCQYQVDRERLPQLHQLVGPRYKEKIILPMMNTVARQVFGTYAVGALYSTARQELEDVMMVKAVAAIGRLPLAIHNFNIRNIVLPKEVEAAIVDKMVAAQRYKRYAYILLTEGEEAKRKHIEAIGIKNFQEIVNAGMTENYLRYQGIMATRELAGSNNAKLVISGGGRDGLPVILNTQDMPAAPAQNATPARPAKPGEERRSESSTPQAAPVQAVPEKKDDRFSALINSINKILTWPITPPPTQNQSNLAGRDN